MLTLAMLMILGTPAQGAYGDWETPAHSVVHVEPCGNDVCLRVVRLPPDAPTTRDAQNPDTGLRGRPLCGLVIGTGFHADTPGRLSGGQLYDPKSGRTYQGTIAVDGNALKLRGYIGISLFGRSETWKRVSAVIGCR